MINSTSYVFILSVCLLKLEDISLFLLEDKEVIELISNSLLTEAVVLLLEEITEEDMSITLIRVMRAW